MTNLNRFATMRLVLGWNAALPRAWLHAGHAKAQTEERETSLNARRFFQRRELVDQRVGSLFQKHAPCAEHSEGEDADQ